MKILLISTHDYRGGAAKVAYNLTNELNRLNQQASLYVNYKSKDEQWIIKSPSNYYLKKIRHFLDYLPMIAGRSKDTFSLQLFGQRLDKIIEKINPDIINFHWTGKGFISFKEINRIAQIKPTVFTLHDQSMLTGGYFLHPTKSNNNLLNKINQFNLNLKNKTYSKNMAFISPSKYMETIFKENPLFKNNKIKIINNGTKIIKTNRKDSRKKLSLNPNKKYLLFGSINLISDKIKGFDYLKKILELNKHYLIKNDVGLISFGNENPFTSNFKELNIEKIHFGIISNSKELGYIFSASNLFILPSIFENYSTVAIESIANGTPVVAFRVGGNEEIINNKKTGYLAKAFDIDDFFKKVKDLLEKPIVISDMEQESFSLENQAKKYLNYFEEVINDFYCNKP